MLGFLPCERKTHRAVGQRRLDESCVERADWLAVKPAGEHAHDAILFGHLLITELDGAIGSQPRLKDVSPQRPVPLAEPLISLGLPGDDKFLRALTKVHLR